MGKIMHPYGKINYPIMRIHNCRIHKGSILNLENFLKMPRIYKIICKNNEIQNRIKDYGISSRESCSRIKDVLWDSL
jgi:hypothetical protein